MVRIGLNIFILFLE